MKIHNKKLDDRPFRAIVKGMKTVEIRANKNNSGEFNSVNDIKPGDMICFTNTKTAEQFSCIVERITLYDSVRRLLEAEGVEKTLTSTINLEEGIKSIESFPGYKDLIAKNGVFAISLTDISLK